ncbi:T9SS type A sorting domain-containing protein, partial [Crocinitomix catalasitica]|nr:T9SS type A sorting domain-containing protein [Crocinitomix catalasitica]
YQFDFAGNEVFTHRVYHKTANYTTLKAVDRAPGGRIYALGEWDHKCIIYRFNDDGSYNAFKQYELLDSLSAKDIVAYGDNDIQVLMDYYVFDDHFPYRTVIKMRVDEYLQFVSAKEYSKGQDVLKGIDLEIKEDRCFIAINDQITDSTTIVEKTNLKGDHILTREIFDQSSPQYCTDIEVRSDQSLALNYHSDSQSIFSGTNEYMQSNCDSHFGSINISDITIAYFNAFPLLLSESFPIINSSFPTSTGSTDYDSEQKCFGFASSVDSEAEIKIFPNPTIALLKIESNEVIQEIEILDQNMRIVLVPAGNLIDLSRLRPGNYIIRLRTDLTVVQKSFVKL